MTEDFVRTGPGTPAGHLMRRFWQPIARCEDLPAGRAAPVRIMSEDFTLYRGERDEGERPHPAHLPPQAPPASPIAMGEGSQGAPSPAAAGEGGGEGPKVHLLAFRCAHRGTQLSTGWVEGDDLRCFYHGWKYGSDGQCVEQPAEPEPFCLKVRIRSYPVEEYLGLIFAYLGEGDPPPMPRFPDFESADGTLEAVEGEIQPCNYFNRIEKAVDPVHATFTHRQHGLARMTIEALETDYGIEVQGLRADGQRWVNHYYFPNAQQTTRVLPRGPGGTEARIDHVAWRIPIDDIHYRILSAELLHSAGQEAERYLESRRTAADLAARAAEVGEAVLAGRRSMGDAMREEDPAVLTRIQDYVTVVAQGAIADRTNEHLGASDAAIALLREIWRRELKALAEGRPIKKWSRPERLEAVWA